MVISAHKKSGFSLVELSIVLVILGLLVGGVLAGQSLIRAAELRAVSTEYARWVTATQTFRDKYFALPGDLPNATAFWGAVDNGDGYSSDCFCGSPTGTRTCNGDADSAIGGTYGGGARSGGAEEAYFWRHLANAGLVEGSYTGISSTTCGNLIYSPGNNAPISKMSNGFWVVKSNPGGAPVGSLLAFTTYTNFLYFGAPSGTGGNDPAQGIMSPAEAWNIDTKLDDGRPGSGKVTAPDFSGVLATCTGQSNATDFQRSYAFNISGNVCRLFFMQAF